MVVEVGPAVDNLKVGDRVAIEPGVPCRRKSLDYRSCHHCRDGLHNLCRDIICAATPLHDGMLFKYYTTQSVFCYPIPSQMSFEEGALVEPLTVAMQVAKAVGTVCKAYGAKKVVRGSIRYTAGCFSAILDLIASGKIDVKRLVTIRFAFEQVEEAFELLSREDKAVEGQGDGEVINVMIAGRKD
ncbi:hypothetical protein ETB97_011476 [Aspergillus alliaceus]|uniref:Alcohol dehydrogenase-like N-terminal domain-containing protein n=1 Tax=Petromyces alliaceus TaxID=209559 RepID=A0A8H6A8B5_PETAA|nr:hypothetical protein ETB97_011476 [Aspergillus burnettii]